LGSGRDAFVDVSNFFKKVSSVRGKEDRSPVRLIQDRENPSLIIDQVYEGNSGPSVMIAITIKHKRGNDKEVEMEIEREGNPKFF